MDQLCILSHLSPSFEALRKCPFYTALITLEMIIQSKAYSRGPWALWQRNPTLISFQILRTNHMDYKSTPTNTRGLWRGFLPFGNIEISWLKKTIQFKWDILTLSYVLKFEMTTLILCMTLISSTVSLRKPQILNSIFCKTVKKISQLKKVNIHLVYFGLECQGWRCTAQQV